MQGGDVGSAPGRTGLASVVRILEADPGLLKGVDSAIAARLRRTVTVEAVHAAPGPLTGFARAPAGVFGLLVLEGVLVRRVDAGSRAGVELLGAGDLVRPWEDETADSSLPTRAAWRTLSPVTFAVLDDGFLQQVHRFVSVAETLTARVAQRCHAAATRLCIAQMPRLEDRVHALFWHLADRWGRMEDGRVVVPLRLSHDLIAGMVCARPPDVSVAIERLAEHGVVTRDGPGAWTLGDGPPAELVTPPTVMAMPELGFLEEPILRPDPPPGVAAA
jgi:CRP-like cAMP-binding protein